MHINHFSFNLDNDKWAGMIQHHMSKCDSFKVSTGVFPKTGAYSYIWFKDEYPDYETSMIEGAERIHKALEDAKQGRNFNPNA